MPMSPSGSTQQKKWAKATSRFFAKVDKTDSCWLWTSFIEGGYGLFWFFGAPRRAHRVSWMIANGEIPGGRMVLHHCDVRHCVNPSHLYLGNALDNCRDMWARGRAGAGNTTQTAAHGKNIPHSKLNPRSVRAIRKAMTTDESIRSIGRRFGVAHGTIRAVRDGVTWSRVK
jgi:hypothetical protein